MYFTSLNNARRSSRALFACKFISNSRHKTRYLLSDSLRRNEFDSKINFRLSVFRFVKHVTRSCRTRVHLISKCRVGGSASELSKQYGRYSKLLKVDISSIKLSLARPRINVSYRRVITAHRGKPLAARRASALIPLCYVPRSIPKPRKIREIDCNEGPTV